MKKNGYGIWIDDDVDYHYQDSLTLIVGQKYNITGIAFYNFQGWTLNPRDTNDVQIVLPALLTQNKQTNIYPNPTKDIIFINNAQKVEIYDYSGRKVQTFVNPNHRINISQLKTGIYLLKVTDNNGQITIHKLIKL
jgi:hypothetical protein